MIGRWLLVTLLLLAALGASYMVWMTRNAHEDGFWLFVVFAVFSFIVAGAGARRKSNVAPKITSQPVETRFAPHWMMMLGAIVLGILLLQITWSLVKGWFF